MKRLPRQCDRTLEQTELHQFSTPATLAYLAARLLNPKSTDIVLEPSAGMGSLAIWPRAIGAKVICNEINPQRNALLGCVFNFDALPLDAEFIDDLLPTDIRPTAVLMNPPLSSTGGGVMRHNPVYGANYVASALRRMSDGGRLVAIVSEAMSFHHPSFFDWWQRIASLCNVRANLTINRNEYEKYGTTSDIQILIIDKTGPTPGANWHEQIKNVCWGSAGTLEEAWQVLKHLVEPSAVHSPDDDPDGGEPSREFLSLTCPRLILRVPRACAPDSEPRDPGTQLALDF